MHEPGWAGSLCRDLSTSFKGNKNQLCNYMITDPTQLDWDPGWKFSNLSRLPGSPENEPNEKQGSGEPTAHAHYFLYLKIGPYCELYCHAVCA